MSPETLWQLVGIAGLGLFGLMVAGFLASLWSRYHIQTIGHLEQKPVPPTRRGLLTRLVTSGPPGEWPLPRIWLLRMIIVASTALACNYMGYR